jgi:hypothetical protein
LHNLILSGIIWTWTIFDHAILGKLIEPSKHRLLPP